MMIYRLRSASSFAHCSLRSLTPSLFYSSQKINIACRVSARLGSQSHYHLLQVPIHILWALCTLAEKVLTPVFLLTKGQQACPTTAKSLLKPH